MFRCLKADTFLSYRLLSGQHLSFLLEEGRWQSWDPWEGRSTGALEVLTVSLAALLCAEQARPEVALSGGWKISRIGLKFRLIRYLNFSNESGY